MSFQRYIVKRKTQCRYRLYAVSRTYPLNERGMAAQSPEEAIFTWVSLWSEVPVNTRVLL